MRSIQYASTRDVAREHRLDHWNSCARAHFPGIVVDADRQSFSAELASWQLGKLLLARSRSSAAIIRRGEGGVAADCVAVHLQQKGLSRQRQGNREVVMHPGDLVISDAAAPLQLTTSDHEVLVLKAPRALLAIRTPCLDARLNHVVSGKLPSMILLHNFFESMWRVGEDAEPDLEEAAGDILLDLLALALGSDQVGRPAAHVDLQRAQRLVEAQLGNPELKGMTLANELGVSLRWVQHLFAGIGTTPSAFILEQRLHHAAAELIRDPRLCVTELAYRIGFNDSGYFSRRFHRRFGMSPSMWRERQRR